ncbi:MAG: 50S ribosomal protein L17 [Candidatus Parcubacteria bacterium]|nr:50S ribosomal protein L17 [Candidatus Parcubacteria bacterium]
MRHKKKGRKFSRKRGVRIAFMKSLAFNLLVKEKIKTTEARAKELRPFIEKFVTRAKIDNLANRKLITARLGKLATQKLFAKISPKYKDRNGGYTRITKLPRRKSDASKMAIIEFV